MPGAEDELRATSDDVLADPRTLAALERRLAAEVRAERAGDAPA